VLNIRSDNPAGGDGVLRTLTLPDGTDMTYRDAGSGPLVLLVHGWAASGGFFDPITERLAEHFRVIVPDLRAHGRTPAGPGRPDIDALADDLVVLLDALSAGPAVALGWSMGAQVLWSLIARHGAERLAGLVVEDMSPRILNDATWSLGMSSGMDTAASQRALAAMRSNWPAYAAAFVRHIFSRDRASRDPDLIQRVLAELRQCDAEAMAALWESMAGQDFRPALPAMRLPVLVTWGEASQAYTPDTSRYLVDTLPNAQGKAFAQSGHAPHLEQPREFARAVGHFAGQVQAGVTHQNKIEGSFSS
jgi:pimeloyl-ACP methyl ester carboxylesterase